MSADAIATSGWFRLSLARTAHDGLPLESGTTSPSPTRVAPAAARRLFYAYSPRSIACAALPGAMPGIERTMPVRPSRSSRHSAGDIGSGSVEEFVQLID